MKKYFSLLIVMFIVSGAFSTSLAQSKLILTTDSITLKAEKLKKLYFEVTNAPDIVKDAYKQQFFDAFPNTFKGLDKLYGYRKDTIGILENVYYNHIIGLFNKLDNIIEDTAYYEKIISIAVDGHWDADAISAFQDGLRQHVLAKPGLVEYLLSKMQDKQIKSFWYFYFDSPYPERNIPDKLSFIKEVDPRIYSLMGNALNEVNQSWKNK